MAAFRPPRVGDLLAVRTTDPHLGEQQVVVDRVSDTRTVLTVAGRLGDTDLEVVLRRVGHHQVPVLENVLSALSDLVAHVRHAADRLRHHEAPDVRAAGDELADRAARAAQACDIPLPETAKDP